MHSPYSRCNAFSSTVILAAMVLVFLTTLSTVRDSEEAEAVLGVYKIYPFRPFIRDRCDVATIRLNGTIDLGRSWSWNVNHVYVSVLAQYETTKRQTNEVVVWDRIISRREDAKILLQGFKKYDLKDLSYGLRGANVSLRVQYNVLPYMGAVQVHKPRSGEYNFTMPKDYIEA